MESEQLDAILWRHISSLPYFRAFLRAVEDSFYQDISLPEPVCDLGSGDGHFASVAFDKKIDVGMDPWVESTMEARKRNPYHILILGDGTAIPFSAGFFGSVISTSVLEHIPDIDPVLEEVARILRPGGKFVFCVPNHRFPEELWGRMVLSKLGFNRLGESYAHLFNRIARHAHTDPPSLWQTRLDRAGLELIDTWDYFPPEALHILEWGHPLGLPSLISKKLFNRWVLVPKRWFLALPWKWTREYLDHPKSDQGVCSFFIAQRKA